MTVDENDSISLTQKRFMAFSLVIFINQTLLIRRSLNVDVCKAIWSDTIDRDCPLFVDGFVTSTEGRSSGVAGSVYVVDIVYEPLSCGACHE